MTGIELVFLGTGGGRFATITQKRRTGGIRFVSEKLHIHLDPGPGALIYSLNMKLNPQKVRAILVSHCHPDHYCLRGDALIQSADGKIVEINHLQDNSLISFDLEKLQSTPSKCIIKTRMPGPNKLCEIKTKTKEIVVTPDHRFFIFSDGVLCEKRARDLKIGDRIAVIAKLNINGKRQRLPTANQFVKKIKLPKYTNPAFCQALGYALGDGSKRGDRGLSLYDKNVSLLKYYKNLIYEVFGIKGKICKDPRQESYHLSIWSKQLIQFLEKIGPLLKRSIEREIPLLICKCSNHEVASFIKGFFDAEGNVGHHSIRFVSSSKKLVRVLQLLLLRFGILSQIREYTFRLRKKKSKIYHLTITHPESVGIFTERIGTSHPEKKEKLLERGQVIAKLKREQVDLLPVQTIIRKLIRILRVRTKDLREIYGYDANIWRFIDKHLPSRNNVSKMLEVFKRRRDELKRVDFSLPLKEIRMKLRYYQKEVGEKLGVSQAAIYLYEKENQGKREKVIRCLKEIRDQIVLESSPHLLLLEKLVHSNIIWDEVTEIEKVDNSGEHVYDLNVPTYHNYVANGIIVHNCDAEVFIEAMTRGMTRRRGVLAAPRSVLWGNEVCGPAISKHHQQMPEKVIETKPGVTFTFDNVKVLTTEARHTDPDTVGYRLETRDTGDIAYTSDTEYFEGIGKPYERVRLLLLCVMRPSGEPWKGHMTTEDAVKIVEEVRPEMVVATHFGMKMIFRGPAREANLIQEKTGVPTLAASDGMRITVGEEIQVERPRRKQLGLNEFVETT